MTHVPRPVPTTDELRTVAAGIRAFVLAANKHPGGSSSAVEAVTALYFSGATTLGPGSGEEGDRLVYSKGHAVAPWYAALWALGAVPGMSWQELAGFGQVGHRLGRMPRRGQLPGAHMSTGALGQGLSFGAGLALADRRGNLGRRTFVLLGDGECTEGQVWEAAMTAAALGLRNLVALVDANGSGSVIRLPADDWAARWSGFGWRTREVDGHDVAAVTEHLREAPADRPTALILHTVKGRGLAAEVEGGNTLGAEAAPRHLPDLDTGRLLDRALAVVDTYTAAAAARRAAPAPTAPAPTAPPPCRPAWADGPALLRRVAETPVGRAPVAKKTLGPELADALAGLPLLWMAPDAIRNSGLLPRMASTGSWSWHNRASDVLQCAIAEQDAASLAGGAAGAGLRPVLFSMEGFYWRMLDQIRESIVFPQLPVLLVGTSGGLGDPLGPMVQSDGCLAALGALPGLEMFEAADVNTAKYLAVQALADGRPAYLRLPHEAVPVRHTFAELGAAPLQDGVLTLRDHPSPDLVVLTAGAMREAAVRAADLLTEERHRAVRVVEVVSTTRFARLAAAGRERHLPRGTAAACVHNAPSTVLGRFLPPGGLALGADGYGAAGWPQEALYEAAGLTARAVADRIAKELL
ncbi:transketolase-like TK C-terminal-containing protein [Actinacidiphila sp. bgisy144]|uniref:transketolase-like TK C-terminal-containing protein n=1 Tax=Actinacidiphila sp. bgisy144 TaxID=3413791 RepID=UPI003EB742C6